MANFPAQTPETLLARFGLESFRPGQREAVQAALDGRDSLVVMPTGGGKSLCYQLPALADGVGLVVVVSPLIALMSDQLRRLQDAGVAAAMLASGMGEGHNEARAARDRRRLGPARAGGARALRLRRLQARAREAGRSACSWSTRPTAWPSGATTSAPTTCAWRGDLLARTAAGDGRHGDGDAGGRRGDRRATGPARAAVGALRLRPSQPLLRRRERRGQGGAGAQARRADARALRARVPARRSSTAGRAGTPSGWRASSPRPASRPWPTTRG